MENFFKECVLEENKECDQCGRCEYCDLDPLKLCDNCEKCLDKADYNGTIITSVDMESF